MTQKPSPDTAALVESFRAKLGLAPWSDHAKTCIHVGGRGSGKTTRLVLEAIAATIERPNKLVVIATMPSSVEPLRKLVRDIAQRLDVETHRVDVVTHSKADEIYSYQEHGPLSRRFGPRKFFSDHYDPQYAAALALVKLRDARRA